MPIGGRLGQLRQILYRLKRGYGCPLTVYRQSPQVIDLETGRGTNTITSLEVKRAILLPAQTHRNFQYDIGFLKANSNFTYGGIYNDSTRSVIIEQSDLKGLVPNSTDEFYIVMSNKRWEIKQVEELEKQLAYELTLTTVDGAIVNQIHRMKLRDHLVFIQSGGLDSDDIEIQDLPGPLGGDE